MDRDGFAAASRTYGQWGTPRSTTATGAVTAESRHPSRRRGGASESGDVCLPASEPLPPASVVFTQAAGRISAGS